MGSECTGALVICALALLGPAVAEAQPAPTVAERETARTLMKSGDTKLAAGDAAGALADFELADRVMAVPSTREAVCRAQERLGRLLAARDTCLSVRNLPTATTPEPDAFVEARARASTLAQAIEPRIATLRVIVAGAATGVTVTVAIDGTAVRTELVGAPMRLDPGRHTVKVVAEGRTFETAVELAEGEARELPAALAPPPPPPAPAPVPAPTVEPDARPAPVGYDSGGPVSPVAWVGFGIAGAGLVLGVVAGGVAVGKANEVKGSCNGTACPEAVADELDAALAVSHVSTVGLAVAGAGALVGFIGLALPGGNAASGEASGSRLRLGLGPAVLTVAGSF